MSIVIKPPESKLGRAGVDVSWASQFRGIAFALGSVVQLWCVCGVVVWLLVLLRRLGCRWYDVCVCCDVCHDGAVCVWCVLGVVVGKLGLFGFRCCAAVWKLG